MTTYPQWPAGVPSAFLADSYTETSAALVLRSTIDAGPAKVRRVTTAATGSVSGDLRMTAAQLATLRTFFASDADAGARWFLFSLPGRAGVSLVRFAAPLVVAPIAAADRWTVTITLDVEDYGG